MNATIQFQKLPESKQINVKHSYPHPLETLWDAFTKTEMLEKWWAPLPYKAKVVTNHFEKGQRLLYYMVGPEGERHYCIAEFLDIDPHKSFVVTDAFCDENGVINTDLPQMKWHNTFSFENGITTITNILNFEKPGDMSKTLEMGFEEGYRTALNQLFDLLNHK
nr:SRPBCC domain-containing protein [uncultured Flavobacterium sp.]